MKEFTTKITDKGQITIPASIRKKLDISPADRLQIKEVKGKIVIEEDKYWEEFERLQRKIQKHLVAKQIKPLTIEEIRSIRERAWRTSD